MTYHFQFILETQWAARMTCCLGRISPYREKYRQ